MIVGDRSCFPVMPQRRLLCVSCERLEKYLAWTFARIEGLGDDMHCISERPREIFILSFSWSVTSVSLTLASW